jgi:hypothetical protein
MSSYSYICNFVSHTNRPHPAREASEAQLLHSDATGLAWWLHKEAWHVSRIAEFLLLLPTPTQWQAGPHVVCWYDEHRVLLGLQGVL